MPLAEAFGQTFIIPLLQETRSVKASLVQRIGVFVVWM